MSELEPAEPHHGSAGTDVTVPKQRRELSSDITTGPLIQVASLEKGIASFRLTEGGVEALNAVFGSRSKPFQDHLLAQIMNSMPLKDTTAAKTELQLNFVLAAISGAKPRDEVEAMLAAQMAVIHCATMNSAWQMMNPRAPAMAQTAEQSLNRLARTFTTQMEALKRYRSTGQQKVTVEHVTVNEGGQAIVGAVGGGMGLGLGKEE